MNELIFANQELGIKVRTKLNSDGSICMNAEDVARGFGWVEFKDEKEYVMWRRFNKFCLEVGFSAQVSKDDYIPESLFYLLGMKANNDTAKRFQSWLAIDVIPEIRKNGTYSMPTILTERDKVLLEMDIVERTSKMLNLNDNSKLLCLHNVLENHSIPTNILPQYTESKGQLLSATELLKRSNINISAIKFNKLMMEQGMIKELERSSSKGVKKFKSLVDTYWGENQVSEKNPKETQILYYEHKFNELLHKLNLS